MIAVVHLVWGPLGPKPLRRFVDSYREYPAGAEHRLVVLFNGVDGSQRQQLIFELAGVDHELLVMPGRCQDLAAYRWAAERVECDRLCFVNSHSEILVEGWLAGLSQAFDGPDVGMVGATGSWASLRSAAQNLMFLPNPYRKAFPKRAVMREQYREMAAAQGPPTGGMAPDATARRFRGGLSEGPLGPLLSLPGQLTRFDGFPNPHLRTNAFMLERDAVISLIGDKMVSKMDTYAIESGHNGLTRRIERSGRHVLIVGRDGRAYKPNEWPSSDIFWQGTQENLLVADNQTRLYADGPMDRRRLLTAYAWGSHGGATR